MKYLENVILMGESKREVEKGIEADWKRDRGIKVKAKATKTWMPFYYRVKVRKVKK